jgi:tetratricopeptide (TPR) repeat protein
VPEPPSLDQITDADPAVVKAVEAARAAVQQSPRSAQAWGRLGMVLSAHEFVAEAMTCFVHAEQLDPREPRWLYYQGIGLSLAQGDQEAAIAKFQRAVERLGDGPDALRLRLGEALLRQGRLDEAEEQFRRVLHGKPDNARAHLDLARLAQERGDLKTSLAHLDRSKVDVHTRKASHELAAAIYQLLGNEAAADQQRQQAAKMPSDLLWPDPFVEDVTQLRTGKQVRLARADRLLGQGRFPEAIALLQQLVRDYPDADWAWLLLGRAYLGKKEWAEAETALRTAAKLAPTSIEVQFYLGVVLLLQDNPQAAAACFRWATEIKPDFAEAHHNLGHCLLRGGDRAGAIEAFRTAVNCKPNYVAAHLDLSELLIKDGQLGPALVHLRAAVRLDPADPKAKKLLKQVLQRIGLPVGL